MSTVLLQFLLLSRPLSLPSGRRERHQWDMLRTSFHGVSVRGADCFAVGGTTPSHWCVVPRKLAVAP